MKWPMRWGREVNARIVQLCHQIVDGLRGLLHLLPEPGRFALVGIGNLDCGLQRVGDGVLLLGLLGRQQCDLREWAAEHLAAVGDDMRAGQLQAAIGAGLRPRCGR